MFLFSIFSDLGIHLDNGLFISRINPGSYAAKEGLLTVGDRIVTVSLLFKINIFEP